MTHSRRLRECGINLSLWLKDGGHVDVGGHVEDGGHVEVGAIRSIPRSVLSQLGLEPLADCVSEPLDYFALETILKRERVP